MYVGDFTPAVLILKGAKLGRKNRKRQLRYTVLRLKTSQNYVSQKCKWRQQLDSRAPRQWIVAE